jgi:hypothetical protein
MAYKTSVIQFVFKFASILNFKLKKKTMLDEQLQVLNLKCREVQESRSNYSLRVTTNIKNLSKCS